MECGSSLPLSARLLAGALWAGSKLPAQKAGASSRTPYRDDFDVTRHRAWSSLNSTSDLFRVDAPDTLIIPIVSVLMEASWHA